MKICKTFNKQTVVVDCEPPPLPDNPPPFGENNVILVQFHFILSKKCIHGHYLDKQREHEQ